MTSAIPSIAQTTGLGQATTAPARQAPGTAGRFLVDYGPKCNDANHEKLRVALQKARYLEGMAARVNNFYGIPRDITISIQEIGTPNAYWSTEKARIVIGYEMLDAIVGAFAQEGIGASELTRKMFNVTEFVFFHELGHCLISELGLPATGREEDAVDQFSTYMLVLLTNKERRSFQDPTSGGFAAVDAAKFFALTSSNAISERAFWDAHSLNQQRFYDILTMVHGSGPRAYEYLVKTKMLPPERAENSVLEWGRVLASWGRLTLPYTRK